VKVNWKAIAFFLLVIVLWQLVSSSGLVNEMLFPGPLKVTSAGFGWASSTLLEDVSISLWRLLAGIILGVTLGTIAGMLMGRILFLEETAAPLFHMLRSLPPVATVPLVIIWFGIGEEAKIFTIAFGAFFPVWLSLLIGSKSIPIEYTRIAQIFAKPKIETYKKVILPAIQPFLMNGIRISIGIAYFMVFVSELAGASSGVGYRMAVAQITYNADLLIAALIVLGAMAFLTDYFFMRIYRRLVHWGET